MRWWRGTGKERSGRIDSGDLRGSQMLKNQRHVLYHLCQINALYSSLRWEKFIVPAGQYSFRRVS